MIKPAVRAFVVIGLLYGSAAAAERHDYWTILPKKEAEKMRQPCSRPLLKELGSVWEPSEANIERAEKKLPAAIDAAFARLSRPEDRRRRPDRYYRQYAGFLRNGKRVIYVSATGVDKNINEIDTREWRTAEILACDTGTYSFSAVYDIEKDRFDLFWFSGRYEGPVPGGGWR
ncbi:MAG TPA: hypothetical protein VGH16_16880 [Candidatus Binatia bacterium]|jgi:hypothetical protein